MYIKVCASETAALREVEGARVFKKHAYTPDSLRVDSRTVLVPAIQGQRGDALDEQALHVKVLELLIDMSRETAQPNDIDIELSITSFVQKRRDGCQRGSDMRRFFNGLLKDLRGAHMIPIHGDLQKQNIFLTPEGDLALIDFEHFCYAPLEFELVNSMFHCDENCLDVDFLVSELNKRGLIDEKLLRKAFALYALERKYE
jgi:RIO-like serine/threonine protein kinase